MDTHFGHASGIKYCDRPFKSLTEINETLVENWNVTVEADAEDVFTGDLTIAESADAFLR